MAGTVPISLQQQFHPVTGRLLVGGKLEFYQSGTGNFQNAFTTSALTTTYGNPLTLEADARVPFLWFADGSIRIKLLDPGGTPLFDFDNLPVIGSSAGGGGVDTTDPNSIASTGDLKWRLSTGTLSGWVRCNARTIGNATSGATERANADTAALFTYLYTNFSDTIAPVSGGRGASAAADYAANKTIGLPNARGRTIFGVVDMGNSSDTSLVAGTPTVGGSGGGAETVLLAANQIPPLTITVAPGPDIFRADEITFAAGTGATSQMLRSQGAASPAQFPASYPNASQAAVNKMPTYLLGTVYIRL